VINYRNTIVVLLLAASALLLNTGRANATDSSPRARNVLFILVDDQRYDAMSCLGHPFLETPAVDSLAANGVRFSNAYVTTSLCSPSRASILTGLYAHTHRVVDNQTEMNHDLVTFNETLQAAGYETAFIGKWHMGNETDSPRPGWSHWVSFVGQGHYYPTLPNGKIAQLNVDGKYVPQTQYITDELTDYALDWLDKQRDRQKPWMLYLSHKAVHSDFVPARRHEGNFANVKLPDAPSTQGTELDQLRPMWARNQRNSWHGAEFPLHHQIGTTETLCRRYYESLLSVDESTDRLLDYLRDTGQLDSTVIIYMGDNGFIWGEHGLIDKRTAYEPSVRVPFLVHCPEMFPSGRVVPEMVANIDVAPTILEIAGIPESDWPSMQGRSIVPLATGEPVDGWRNEIIYEYFWERWAPSTPTIHALVTPRWKYVRAYGVWDVPELYDTQSDPHELRNLFNDPEHHQRALEMDKRLFDQLERTGGESIPLLRGWKGKAKQWRHPDKSEWADFPKAMVVPKESDAN